MEDELLYEENFEEVDIDNELSNEDIIVDTTISKYEGTAEKDKETLTDDILSALEEEGYIIRSVNEEIVTPTPSVEVHGEYYDTLIEINSHLEYIEEHLYEPVEKDINTPLNEYDLTNILLVGVFVVLIVGFAISAIKNNVFKLR